MLKIRTNIDNEELENWLHKKTNKKIEKSSTDIQPDAYTEEIYNFLDLQLEKAGLDIGGKQPRGVKQVGKQIETKLYNSLKKTVDEYLGTIASDSPQHEVIHGVEETVKKWQEGVAKSLDKTLEEFYTLGYKAGIAGTGVKPAMNIADKLALRWIQENPNSIGSKIVTFSKDIVDKFRKIIEASYGPEGEFSLSALMKEMKGVVGDERFKIERIARTEVASTAGSGRLLAYSKDPDRHFFEYHWDHVPDNRQKYISKLRGSGSPYTFTEICFLFQNQSQFINNRWQPDIYNQRCSVSRSPIDKEWKGNRFAGQEANFKETTPLGFDYKLEE